MRGPTMVRWGAIRPGICALLSALLLLQGALPLLALADEDRPARVTASSLNVRGGPATTHAALRSLPEGTHVVILEEQDGWSRIRLEDGTIGWAASRYLEALALQPPSPAEETPADSGEAGAPEGWTTDVRRERGGGGTLRAVAKWGSLAGALVLGGLAYSEHSQGNDAYDDYETLFRAGSVEAAEVKYDEAEDHDGSAQTYAIAAGALFGLFLLQQFVLGGGGGEERSAGASIGPLPPALAAGPGGPRISLALVGIRF